MGSVTLGSATVSIDLVLFLLSVLGGLLVVIPAAAPHQRQTVFLLIRIVLLGIFAARATYIYVNVQHYMAAPWTAGSLNDGGFIIFAGFVAAIGATIWYAWRNRALRHPLVLAVSSAFVIWGVGLNVFWLLRTDQVQFPKITLTALNGRPVEMTDFLGKPIVVNLWATWCPPCQREMPLLSAAQQQHADITFLFVNQGESGQLVKTYMSARTPLLRNVLLDTAGQFPVHVGSQALPVTLFFSASGVLIGKHVGELSEPDLEQELLRLGDSAARPPAR